MGNRCEPFSVNGEWPRVSLNLSFEGTQVKITPYIHNPVTFHLSPSSVTCISFLLSFHLFYIGNQFSITYLIITISHIGIRFCGYVLFKHTKRRRNLPYSLWSSSFTILFVPPEKTCFNGTSIHKYSQQNFLTWSSQIHIDIYRYR